MSCTECEINQNETKKRSDRAIISGLVLSTISAVALTFGTFYYSHNVADVKSEMDALGYRVNAIEKRIDCCTGCAKPVFTMQDVVKEDTKHYTKPEGVPIKQVLIKSGGASHD